MTGYQALKGMRDILPGEVETWQELESKARHLFEANGFEEVRTPLLEPAELFVRSIGEGSDIVHKQMYVFEDRGGRSVTLRPEMTASVVRAAIENGLIRSSKTVRLYYLGPMFRAERPQKGRQRQFHQMGAEILNAQKVEADLEILQVAWSLLEFCGVRDLQLKHNYLGSEAEKHAYAKALRDHFAKLKDRLCEDCHYRIEKNVLRVMDCKAPLCQPLIAAAPPVALNEDSEREYDEIRRGLEARGISSDRDPRLVRGLDYYSGLVFEMTAGGELGAQDAVAAGGRYDHLIASMGGPSLSATGFAAGMERILLAAEGSGRTSGRAVYVATLDGRRETEKCFQRVMQDLYRIGRRVKREPGPRSLADHLKRANKGGFRYVVILGENEIKTQSVTVKDLEAKRQVTVPIAELASYFVGAEEELC